MTNKYSLWEEGAESNLSKKENLLFRNINEFNKYLLLTVGVFIITLSGTISYFVNTSYGSWNSVSYSGESFEFDVSLPTHIEISNPPTKLEYEEGEVFNSEGMVVKQVYSSGRKVVVEDFDISPKIALTENDTAITISYGDFTTTQNITVLSPQPNAPALLSNMIPVYYDETCNNNAGCWEKADSTNVEYDWYNYDEKMWANAVTVDETNRQNYISAPEGTEIPMTEINAMWVWIPRYTYTYFNDGTNTPKEIEIQFEEGTASNGTVTCTDNVKGSGSISQTCTDSNTTSLVPGTSTYTHPAFTFGDTQLTGFWIGKFENSATSIPTSESTEEHTLIIKPNEPSLRNKTVSYQFKDVRQMEKYNNIYGFEQINETTFKLTGELTGDTNNLDTHMLKNIEWGAVAYLSHSKYGINKEIAINSKTGYTTGCGPQSETSTDYGATCNEYNSELGHASSTTGNVYGVYDMSGGAIEHVMGNMVNSSNQFYPSNAGQWSATTKPLVKYYDSYTYDKSNYQSYSRGRLGDATVEMQPNTSSKSWYSDYADFMSSSMSWFFRGGNYSNGVNAGAFYFLTTLGMAGRGTGSRSALVVLN